MLPMMLLNLFSRELAVISQLGPMNQLEIVNKMEPTNPTDPMNRIRNYQP